MKKIYDFLKSLNISKDEPIVVAVSYGPDSMFLLDLLKDRYSNIICAHVHHNHRKESDLEKERLEKYCTDNSIKFEFKKIDEYKNNRFTEEEARNIRYAFFEDLVHKYNSKYLFTAHHGDDLIETVLMRLVRGSSVLGYSGIKLISERKDYYIVRPLLFLTKDDILVGCKNKNIPYSIDESNNSCDYTRNRYRKYVVPFLKSENKNVHLKFLQFSNIEQEYDNYINRICFEKYKKISKNGIILINELNKEDAIIVKKIIELWLKNEYQASIEKITSKNVNDIVNMVTSNKANSKVSLPLKKAAVKSYGKLYFEEQSDNDNYLIEFKKEVLLPNNCRVKIINKLDNTSNYVTALNSNEISFPLYFRNRKPGDLVQVLGMKGQKKLKDIFIDEKIIMKERNIFPVLVDASDNIIWLPGLKKTKYDKSKAGKYDIILRCYREEEYETTK